MLVCVVLFLCLMFVLFCYDLVYSWCLFCWFVWRFMCLVSLLALFCFCFVVRCLFVSSLVCLFCLFACVFCLFLLGLI